MGRWRDVDVRVQSRAGGRGCRTVASSLAASPVSVGLRCSVNPCSLVPFLASVVAVGETHII